MPFPQLAQLNKEKTPTTKVGCMTPKYHILFEILKDIATYTWIFLCKA